MEVKTNSPLTKKFPILPWIGIEGTILALLVILIVISLNYFSILPVSIPFFPHQIQNQNLKQNQTTLPKTNVAKFERNPKCENLPAGIVMPKINSSTESATLKAYLGIWGGKWDKIPTALIITRVSKYGANGQYFYNGQQSKIGSVYLIKNNILTSPDGQLEWKFQGNTLVGKLYSNGKIIANSILTRCSL